VDLLNSIIIFGAGFLGGLLIASGIVSWANKLIILRREGSSRGVVIAAGLLHSAPWTLVGAAIFAYFMRSTLWAPSLLWGALLGCACVLGFSAYVLKGRRTKNAA
jgi:hypothetical protein